MGKRFKRASPLVILLLVVFLAGCASWAQLSGGEKTRVSLSLLQDQLVTLRTGAVKWALNLPQGTDAELKKKREILTVLHEKILPAMKLAQETIGAVAVEAKNGNIDREAAQRLVLPFINRVILLLAQIGYIGG